MQKRSRFAEKTGLVTVSIVSHGHGAMVSSLLHDLAVHCGSRINVIVTLNIPESFTVRDDDFPFSVRILRNDLPNGFGANHNAAFNECESDYFCILNPDIRIEMDPFPALVDDLANSRVGVVAPKIVNPAGEVEDSARRFPTIGSLVRKLFGIAAILDYKLGQETLSPDWVAGMFMLFRATVFEELHGFDDRFFLYYEDVDLCRRLRKRGYEVHLVPSVNIVHDARRESHRSLRHLRWHLASVLRFLLTR